MEWEQERPPTAEEYARRMMLLPGFLQQLQQCASAPALFATAADLARWSGDYDWAVVLTISQGQLSARECGVLEHAPSDLMRRRLLSEPIPITAGSREGRWLRLGMHYGVDSRGAPSVFDDPALGMQNATVGLIAPDSEVLAVLVASRGQAADPVGEATVAGIAAMTSVVLARLVLTARLSEATATLRHLSVSAEALIEEVARAPIQVPTSGSRGPTFVGLGEVADRGPAARSDLLSRRENEVAALLVEGRSDREIAEALVISVNTAKDHVARVRRKLNAGNRVEAAAKYVRLLREGG